MHAKSKALVTSMNKTILMATEKKIKKRIVRSFDVTKSDFIIGFNVVDDVTVTEYN